MIRVCIPMTQGQDKKRTSLITSVQVHSRQRLFPVLKLFYIRTALLLCGTLPSSPLLWAGPSGAVTGGTGGGVASPQKSSGLSKHPRIHRDFLLSFSACSWAALEEVFLPCQKRGGSCYTMPPWQCSNLPLLLCDAAIFYSLSSIMLLVFSHLYSLCERLQALLYCSSITPTALPPWFLSPSSSLELTWLGSNLA